MREKNSAENLSRYREEFLLNWDTIVKDCGVRFVTDAWINRVKEIGMLLVSSQDEAAAIVKAKGSAFSGPESFLASTEISLKTFLDCMDRSEIMHRVRVALAAFPDDLVLAMLCGNYKIPYAGPLIVNVSIRKNEKERERDLGLPVWWTFKHDVDLLKLAILNDMTNWKKQLNFSIPTDFEVPKKDGDNDLVMELTPKAAEKRLNIISKNIQPVKWLKLEQMKGNYTDFPTMPPGSPEDKLQNTNINISKPRQLFSSIGPNSDKVVCSLFTLGKRPIVASTQDSFTSAQESNSADNNSDESITTTQDSMQISLCPNGSTLLKRKQLSEEAKSVMIEKRKATIAAKKSAAEDALKIEGTPEELEVIVLKLRAQLKEAVGNEDFENAALLKKTILRHDDAITKAKKALKISELHASQKASELVEEVHEVQEPLSASVIKHRPSSPLTVASSVEVEMKENIEEVVETQSLTPAVVEVQVQSSVDEKVPEIFDEKVPEIVDEKVPEIFDEKVPEIVDEKVPEIFEVTDDEGDSPIVAITTPWPNAKIASKVTPKSKTSSKPTSAKSHSVSLKSSREKQQSKISVPSITGFFKKLEVPLTLGSAVKEVAVVD